MCAILCRSALRRQRATWIGALYRAAAFRDAGKAPQAQAMAQTLTPTLSLLPAPLEPPPEGAHPLGKALAASAIRCALQHTAAEEADTAVPMES